MASPLFLSLVPKLPRTGNTYKRPWVKEKKVLQHDFSSFFLDPNGRDLHGADPERVLGRLEAERAPV